MAQSLTITKQTGNFFTLDLVVDAFAYPQVISDKNRMLTQGTLCDFKTANGANLIKKQNIDVTEITVIASGTFTFVSTFTLWNKLKDVGFFDGLSSGGSASIIDRFDELLDTFPYVSNNGYVPVVDVSQQKLVATPFYNYRTFLELEDVLATALVANKIVAVDSLGTGLILIDAPATPETYLNAVGSFHYNDLATQTTPLTIVASVPKKLTNDTDGANTILTNAPYGVSNVWDDANNEFDLSALSVGDLVTIRLDVEFTTSSANQNYSLYINFGIGSASPFSLMVESGLIKTAGAKQIVATLNVDIAYSDTKDYPAQIFLLSDNGGTLKVNGWYVDILRKNINIVDVSTSVNLSATQSPTNVTVVNSGGDDAVLPSANNTNAGILLPIDYNKIQSAQQVNQKDVSNGYVGLSGFRIRMLNTLGTIDSYLRNSATATREWIFPDKSGTVAMTSDIANKQDTLISNVNIKTINGNTLLGSGNLVISGGGGGGSPSIPITYAALVSAISGSTLVKGQVYLLTDYTTTYTQPVTLASKTSGVTEPLYITATDVNELNPICRSELYPQDIVYYEVTGDIGNGKGTEGFTKGKIYRRIDTLKNNDIGTDWRHIKYDRSGTDTLLFANYTNSYNNTIETYYLFNNVVGVNFYDNVAKSNFYNNTINSGCDNNFFGFNCFGNTIGTNFQHNTCTTSFKNNSIGDLFTYNVCRGYFNANSFLVACSYNTFQFYFSGNTVNNNLQLCIFDANFISKNIMSVAGLYSPPNYERKITFLPSGVFQYSYTDDFGDIIIEIIP